MPVFFAPDYLSAGILDNRICLQPELLDLKMKRPVDEMQDYTAGYMGLVSDDVLGLLAGQLFAYPELLLSLNGKGDYRYAPGKWTVAQIARHIIDTERILAYRLLCFVRCEMQALPGFDQDDYMEALSGVEETLQDLAEEFEAVRTANMFLFNTLSEKDLDKEGISSGKKRSARALLFTIAGHLEHHRKILNERYA